LQPVLPAEAFFVLRNEMKEEAKAGNLQREGYLQQKQYLSVFKQT